MAPPLQAPRLVTRRALAPALLAISASMTVPAPARAETFRAHKPTPDTQTQKTAEERGGVRPCNTHDPGFGGYHRWERTPSLGQMIVPRRLPSRQQVDVMIHFHGHEAARKAWVPSIVGPVLVGIDLGTGSAAYRKAFEDPTAFPRLLESIERGVAKRAGVETVTIRHLGLSGWSAGYGAVGQILRSDEQRKRVDTVVLLDGLHTTYAGPGLIEVRNLKPYVQVARRAARGQGFFFMSHSSIVPPTYASTTETAEYLVHALGGAFRPSQARATDPMGLELFRWYRRGSFHVRGFRGNDKPDHCAHFGVFRDVLRFHVVKRWR